MIVFSLDESAAHLGLHLTEDGKPVEVERAFREGFYIPPQDANVALTLLSQFVTNRDHAQI